MNDTIGQKLREEREARSLTIDQVASATRIRAHYLRAIELGKLNSLPSMVHTRGFLRAYADFLGLDLEPLIADLENQAPAPEEPKTAVSSEPLEPTKNDFQKSAEIFAEIGQSLRERRELLGLSLEDVERHTFLKQHYLQALEKGNLADLPSPVQGRGMLNNYASFLGMNAETLLLRFAEGLQAQLEVRRGIDPSEPKPEPVVEAPSPPERIKRFFSADLIIGGSIAIFLAVFLFWGAIRIFNMVSNQAPTQTAPSIAQVLLATPTPTETFTPEPVTPTSPSQAQLFPTLLVPTGTLPEGALPIQSEAAVQVYLTILQRAWMRVLVDGEIQFEGRVLPGSAYPFIGNSTVEILTGNGAALRVFYNGVDLGPMGNMGEVINQIFTPQGILTPTPTITLTPTSTPEVPPTLSPPETTPAP